MDKDNTSPIICMVSTIYALLLYLLYQSYDKIMETFFVFDYFIIALV